MTSVADAIIALVEDEHIALPSEVVAAARASHTLVILADAITPTPFYLSEDAGPAFREAVARGDTEAALQLQLQLQRQFYLANNAEKYRDYRLEALRLTGVAIRKNASAITGALVGHQSENARIVRATAEAHLRQLSAIHHSLRKRDIEKWLPNRSEVMSDVG